MATRQVLGGWADMYRLQWRSLGAKPWFHYSDHQRAPFNTFALSQVDMLVQQSVMLQAPGTSKQSHTVLAQQIRPNEGELAVHVEAATTAHC